VLTSGIGVGGGMSFGAGSSVTLITIGSGVLTQRNILDSQSLFVRGIYKNGTVLYGSSSSSTFGMNVDDQGIPFKSSDTSSNGNGGVQISQGNPMTYGAGIQWTLSNPGRTQVGAGNSGGAVEVIGDMEDGGGKGGLGSGVEEVMVAEEKPLLQGAMEGYGQQHGITTITRRRMMNADSVDVGNFINSRVGEADREYILSYDALHIYRYEGDDSDIDDLSELGSDDEGGDDAEQSFDFLQDWGRKFENLNKIYNLDD
ncbi:predicted protein, partial [Nematostella vectensis]